MLGKSILTQKYDDYDDLLLFDSPSEEFTFHILHNILRFNQDEENIDKFVVFIPYMCERGSAALVI